MRPDENEKQANSDELAEAADPDSEDTAAEAVTDSKWHPGDEGSDEIEIIVDPSRKRHKRDKSAKRTKSQPKKPSEEEILSRLMEKNQAIVKLNKILLEKDKKIKEIEDKYLRSLADFENYRKRTRKEWELLKQQSKAEVILEVLNVLDDFERAFSAVGQVEGDDFFEGVRLIYNNLVLALERFDIKPMEALGKPFDPTYHMAVAQVDAEDSEPHRVVEVAQQGYLMGDIVIRPARVIIAK